MTVKDVLCFKCKYFYSYLVNNMPVYRCRKKKIKLTKFRVRCKDYAPKEPRGLWRWLKKSSGK